MTTGIAACPCHFPITLPIVVGALGGTSLGGFIAASTGLVYGVGAAYFMIGIGLSLYLLNRRSARAGAMHVPLGTKRAGPVRTQCAQARPMRTRLHEGVFMEIEVLYFDGCATWRAAVSDLQEVLSELGLEEEVLLVRVESREEAERLRFLGSPTVRVNGKDVEPGTPSDGFGMECRLYWVDGKPTGSPPKLWIRDAIGAAHSRHDGERRETPV